MCISIILFLSQEGKMLFTASPSLISKQLGAQPGKYKSVQNMEEGGTPAKRTMPVELHTLLDYHG